MTGTKIWLDYDQAQLDDQYNQRSIVPDGDDYKAGDAEASKRARAELACRLDAPYGDDAAERIDLFPAAEPGAPILVFIHGGAWARGAKSNESFVAPPFVAAGAAVAVPEFGLAPDYRLDQIIDQCRRAVGWIHANAAELNGDAARIVLCGHSSGSHLSSMLMTTDWAARGLPPDPFKGVVITSGIYDLAPVRLSYRNDYLFLDDAAVERLSPIRRLTADLPTVAMFFGGLELAEFRRQGREFADALTKAGVTYSLQDLPGLNHFEMGRQLADTDSPVHRAAMRFLGLGD